MALHRELFTKLAPAEEIRRGNRDFLNNEMEADGFYIIVQDIARKYGDRAYEIAEKVFAENGMSYDPKELRTPGAVRRVGYVFEGANVYNIKVADYKPEMIKDLLWLYNREIRNVSRECFMDEESFKQRIASGKEEVEGLFLAYNEGRQRVGFIHCHIGDNGEGSVEAMFFPGRPYSPACRGRAGSEGQGLFCRPGREKSQPAGRLHPVSVLRQRIRECAGSLQRQTAACLPCAAAYIGWECRVRRPRRTANIVFYYCGQ